MKLSIDMRKSRGHAWIFGMLAATNVHLGSSLRRNRGRRCRQGMKVTTDPSEPLKIAMFMPAVNTSYLQANIKGAQDEAAKVGGTISLFDAKFDPMNQLNQMQNAISDEAVQRVHRVPAWRVRSSARWPPRMHQKLAYWSARITSPLCNTTFEADDKQWAPGTLQYVGGSSSYPVFLNYHHANHKDKSRTAKGRHPDRIGVGRRHAENKAGAVEEPESEISRIPGRRQSAYRLHNSRCAKASAEHDPISSRYWHHHHDLFQCHARCGQRCSNRPASSAASRSTISEARAGPKRRSRRVKSWRPFRSMPTPRRSWRYAT